MTDKSQPHNLEAERSLLGAVIASFGKALDDVADKLSPAVFYTNAHQRIFTAMLALYGRGEAIDLVTLMEELRKADALEAVGGVGYVSGLADGVPRSTNIAYYARIISEKASFRAVISLADRLLVSAYAADQDAPSLVDEAERGLLEISGAVVPGDLAPSVELTRRLYPVLEAISTARRPVTGLSTGFEQLDNLTRGLQPGNLIILGARPSQGKSSLAAQMALHAAQSVPVAFFSIEMSEQEQGFRLLASLAQVDGHLLQAGQLPKHEMQRVGAAFSTLEARQLWIDESGSLSALQLRSKARRMKARHGLGLIIVDYLQLMQHQKADSREQQVATTGRTLKLIARELQVPVLALCQLSRAVEQRAEQRPKLSDLRESGSLEQDCDVALLLYRPPQPEGAVSEVPPTELLIAKQRNGPIGKVDLRWRGEQYRFLEVA